MIISLLVVLLLFMPGSSRAQEKIVEEVAVTNIEVPVRVFHEEKPVTGLKKENFKLLVNGREREINGFFEHRQTIVTSSPSPRLFLLIFNICDYHLDIGSAVDHFPKRSPGVL